MITGKHLSIAKNTLKIFHTAEDEHIRRLLESSYNVLKEQVGDFDIDTDNLGSELVYERVRYMYNDALEYFEDNFRTQIVELSIKNKLLDSVDD